MELGAHSEFFCIGLKSCEGLDLDKVSLWFLYLSEHWHLSLVQCRDGYSLVIRQEDIVLLKGDLSLWIFSDILFVRLIHFWRRKKQEGRNSCYGLLLFNGDPKSIFLQLILGMNASLSTRIHQTLKYKKGKQLKNRENIFSMALE